jgi:hypothetical protein
MLLPSPALDQKFRQIPAIVGDRCVSPGPIDSILVDDSFGRAAHRDETEQARFQSLDQHQDLAFTRVNLGIEKHPDVVRGLR